MKCSTPVRLLAVTLIITLFMTVFPPLSMVSAETYVAIYDFDKMSYFSTRTKDQIATNYSKAFYPSNSTYIDANKASYYSEQPSLTAPYSAGTLSPSTLSVLQSTINYFRWLVGADSLKKTCSSSSALQAAALVRNFDFSHEVSDHYRPADMSTSLWNLGKNAEHNIISKYSTPQKTAAAWLDEGYDKRTGAWSSNYVGHRMLILDAKISGLDFGYCGNCCVGKYTDLSGTTDLPFLAYPAPGFMPLNNLPAQTSAWSIQLNKAKITYKKASDLSVTVKNLSTGESYTCTTANGKLHVTTLANGLEAISFVQPSVASGKYYYADGAQFTVTASGFTEIGTGYAAELRYTTKMFDVINYEKTTVAKVEPTSYSTVTVYQPNATPELLEALCSALPKTVTVTGKTGFSVTLPITSDGWQYDSVNKVYRAKITESYLPSVLSDPNHLLRDVQLKLILDSNDFMKNSHIIVPEIAEAGSDAEIKIWRYYNNLEHSEIYQISDTGIRKRFDSKLNSYTIPGGTAYHVYDMTGISETDEGNYFGIYYSDNLQVHEAFVTDCKPVQVVKGKQVGLMLESLPDKLVYQPGDPVSLIGMVLLVVYDDGTVARLTNFSGFVLKIIDHNESDSTVEVTYGDYTVSFDVVYSTMASDYMLISKLPDKLYYETGDRTPDLTGGELLVYHTDAEPQVVPMTKAGVSGFDTSKVGEKMITLTYNGMQVAFTIHVQQKNYTVTWVVDNRSYRTSVTAGAMPVFPETPKKASDRFYNYIFTGWDKPVVAANGDAVYTACFKRALIEDCAANIYPDVSINAWYCKNVLQAVSLGLFDGNSDGTFAPTAAMTRAMLVTVLWSMEGKPKPKDPSVSFTDVKKNAWYANAVLWAAENGIVSGVGGGKFAPDNKITREQLAAILYQYSGGRGASAALISLNAYPDSARVSGWAKISYAWAIANGVLSGIKDGNAVYLKPQNNATRAEVATMLISYLRNFANIP